MRQMSDAHKYFVQYAFMDDPNEIAGDDRAGCTGHDQNGGGGGGNGGCRESCGEGIVAIAIVGDAVDLLRLVPYGGPTRDTSVGLANGRYSCFAFGHHAVVLTSVSNHRAKVVRDSCCQ